MSDNGMTDLDALRAKADEVDEENMATAAKFMRQAADEIERLRKGRDIGAWTFTTSGGTNGTAALCPADEIAAQRLIADGATMRLVAIEGFRPHQHTWFGSVCAGGSGCGKTRKPG